MNKDILVHNLLLLYNLPVDKLDAATIMEHINAFEKYSKFNVIKLNTELGISELIEKTKFEIIVFHYSLFGDARFKLDKTFFDCINTNTKSLKVAFFQDEYKNCLQRFEFINKYKIDIIFSCLESRYFKEVYYENTIVKKVINTIPSFVEEELLNKAKEFSLAQINREIDIGYRGRRLSAINGKGA